MSSIRGNRLDFLHNQLMDLADFSDFADVDKELDSLNDSLANFEKVLGYLRDEVAGVRRDFAKRKFAFDGLVKLIIGTYESQTEDLYAGIALVDVTNSLADAVDLSTSTLE